jgi:HNH endonuclease
MSRVPAAEPLLTLPVPRTSPTFALRVLAAIDFDGDCWQWTKATQDGYGVVGRGARGSGTMQAHRAVWEMLVGQIADGLQLDHLCRNRACCNPDHLEPVTAEENKRRGYSVASLHRLRDTCLYDHPKDGIARRKDGTSHRYCKTCARRKSLARYYAGRAA